MLVVSLFHQQCLFSSEHSFIIFFKYEVKYFKILLSEALLKSKYVPKWIYDRAHHKFGKNMLLTIILMMYNVWFSPFFKQQFEDIFFIIATLLENLASEINDVKKTFFVVDRIAKNMCDTSLQSSVKK